MASVFSGSVTLDGDGDVRIAHSPFPIVGTVTMTLTGDTWTGDIIPKKRVIMSTQAIRACTYQTADSTTDIAAGTAITGDEEVYVRCDAEQIYVTVENHSAGTMLLEWAWSAG